MGISPNRPKKNVVQNVHAALGCEYGEVCGWTYGWVLVLLVIRIGSSWLKRRGSGPRSSLGPGFSISRPGGIHRSEGHPVLSSSTGRGTSRGDLGHSREVETSTASDWCR